MTASTGSDVVEHVVGVEGELRVRLHSGELQLRGVEGDAVRIRDLDGGDLAERFTIEAADGRLSIKPRDRFLLDFGFGLAGFGRGARLTAEVPFGARLTVDTASADVRATALRGDQRYRTASGSIELDQMSGDIAVDAVSGDVDVRLAGEAAVGGRAVSGNVTLSGGRLRSLAMATTSGDVRIDSELVEPGPFGVQTVSGDVLITGGRGLRVEANTVTGDISAPRGQRSQSGRGRHVVTTGDAGIPFSFRSISGDLRVIEAGTSEAHPGKGPGPEPDARNDERLAILRDLEAGTIDVDTASARLAELEEAES